MSYEQTEIDGGAHWVAGALIDVTEHFPDGHMESLYILSRSDQNGNFQSKFMLDGQEYFLPVREKAIYRVTTKPYIGLTFIRIPAMGCKVGDLTEKRHLERLPKRVFPCQKVNGKTVWERAILSLYERDAELSCREDVVESDLSRCYDDSTVEQALKV